MKVVIAGYGVEGKASYEYWRAQGHEVTVADERTQLDNLPSDVETLLGDDAFTQLDNFDLIVRSPSVNPAKLPYGERMWSATREFFEVCPAEIIGVTGTKGKGTTSSLIASILGAAGKKVHLVGNIGTPALEELPKMHKDDIVVFELSSFQLWDLTRSPQVAVILKIEADHLDVHEGMEDYVAAKANIRRFQTSAQTCFYHPFSEFSAKAANIMPGAVRYGIKEDGGVYAEHGWFMRNEERLCLVDAMQIPGEHNIENACAALSVACQFTTDTDAMEHGLELFTGLPHRIKFVRSKSDVSFYDDSYSSAPSAALAALAAFDAPKVIMLGGYDKGADFNELAAYMSSDQSMKKAVVYGQTRNRLVDSLIKSGLDSSRIIKLETDDFKEIVSAAADEATAGDVVLLSPACASFDMFNNFTERGDRFIEIVNNL